LSFGLLDLLTLPQRQAVAKLNVDKVQLQLAQQLVRQLSDVKLAWVGAIAANQRLLYAQQVQRSANASAELAKRLKAVGNFSWLQQASQQQFASDAAIQLATAQHTNISATQHLVRLLGLNTSQEALMRLPKKLPSIPKQTLSPEDVSAVAMDARLDVQLAKLDVTRLLGSNTLAQIDSFTDVEWGIRGVDKKDTADGSVSQSNGFEVAIRLPIFDWGDNKRVALSANSLIAAKNYESTMLNASSELRVSYSAYRTAYDLAAHYQNEVIPMRARMAEENQYSYNGMLISVFELLADARQQVAAVTQSLNAVEQFWASEAALQNSLLGAPSAAVSVSAASAQADSPGH
jgi:outer membrane protein TolC